MKEPVPLPPPAFWTKKRQYLLGLGLGLVPVVLLLAGVGNLACAGRGGLPAAAGYLYVAQIVGGLICVCFDRIRSVGYGLLTMALAGPVVAAIGCAVILSQNLHVQHCGVDQPPPPPRLQFRQHNMGPSYPTRSGERQLFICCTESPELHMETGDVDENMSGLQPR